MKKFLLMMLLFLSADLAAKEITVTAEGYGENYDWAVLNAVENAVRQTSDITITGMGLKKIDSSVSVARGSVDTVSYQGKGELSGKDNNNDIHAKLDADEKIEVKSGEKITMEHKDNSKVIPAQYQGIVSSYEVLEHKQEINGEHFIKIKALIIKEDVYDSHDYQSKTKQKKPDRSLAILPFKLASGVQLNCFGEDVLLETVNQRLEPDLMKTFSKNYNLLDRSNFDAYSKEMALIEGDWTLPENKVRLKNIVSADYILVGTIDQFKADTRKKTNSQTGKETNENLIFVKYTYKILETATMEIIEVNTLEQTFSSDEFPGCFKNQYISKGLGEKSDYSLVIAPFKSKTGLRCLGQKVSLDNLNDQINGKFTEYLSESSKFNLLDRSNFDAYAQELSLVTNDLTSSSNKGKLKNIVSSDYMLVGSVDALSASTDRQYVELTGETNYNSYSKLKISYKLI